MAWLSRINTKGKPMEIGLTITPEVEQAKMPVLTLHLRGCLDAYTEHQLLDAAQKAYDQGTRYLVLDLNEVETLASAGIRAIHRIILLYKPSEEPYDVPRVKLAHASAPIHQVLNITGILLNNPMYHSATEALDSWG
jgi:anti-anti-sigma factor